MNKLDDLDSFIRNLEKLDSTLNLIETCLRAEVEENTRLKLLLIDTFAELSLFANPGNNIQEIINRVSAELC